VIRSMALPRGSCTCSISRRAPIFNDCAGKSVRWIAKSGALAPNSINKPGNKIRFGSGARTGPKEGAGKGA